MLVPLICIAAGVTAAGALATCLAALGAWLDAVGLEEHRSGHAFGLAVACLAGTALAALGTAMLIERVTP